MLREHRLFIRRVLIYLHVGISFVAYTLSMVLRQRIEIPGHKFVFNEWTHLILATSGITLLAVLHALLGVYRSNRLFGFFNEALRIALAHAIVFVTLLALAAGLRLDLSNRLQLGLFIALDATLVLALQLLIRGLAAAARKRGYNFRNLVVVVSGPDAVEPIVRRVRDHAWWGLRIAAVVTPPLEGEAREQLKSVLPPGAKALTLEECEPFFDHEPVDELWMEGLPVGGAPHANIGHAAAMRGISVRCLLPPDLFFGARWSVESFGGVTALTAARVPIDDFALALKRPFDFLFALLVLLLVAPILLVAALLIAGTGGLPILFRQERVGLNGRSFTLWKFRTMHRDAEQRLASLQAQNEMQGPVFKMKDDPRITPVGRWLRRFSIDELPQLFNVLRGEMSLVGPRPPLATEVNLYEPRHRRRLSVRPGITGLWQVKGRNEISRFEDWVQLDLDYIDRWSLWLDLAILLRTIPAVLFTRGAR